MALGEAAPGAATTADETASLAPVEPEATLTNRRGQTLLAGFTAAHVSHHISNSLLNPLLPLIRDSFALSYTQSGFLVSAFAVSLGLSNAPIGLLADRVGPRRVLAIGLILTGAISAAVAFSGAYWQLLGLLVVMGVIAGTYHAPAASLLVQAFAPRVRGAALGLHITGGHMSFFATPLVAAFLVDLTGTWRTPYLWLAFVPVLFGVLLWYLAPRAHKPPPASVDRWAAVRDVWGVVRLVGPLVSVSILYQVVYQALFAFTALYLVDARGLPATTAAIFFGVPQLAGMFGAPLSGYLSDRLGRRTVIVLGIGLLGPSFYALALAPNELLLVPLVAIGLTASMRQTVTEVLVIESAPAHRRSTVLGAYYMLAQELGGFAAPVFGLLAGVFGIGAAFGGATLAMALGSAVVAIVQVQRRILARG